MAKIGPGDKVVCVDASRARWHEPKEEVLARGRIYVCKRVLRAFPFGGGFPRAALIRPEDVDGQISYWDLRRFRKVEPASEKFTTWVRKAKPMWNRTREKQDG